MNYIYKLISNNVINERGGRPAIWCICATSVCVICWYEIPWFQTIQRTIVYKASRRSLTGEARVQSQVSARGICDKQSGTETGYSSSTSAFTCQYHSTQWLICYQRYIIVAIDDVFKQHTEKTVRSHKIVNSTVVFLNRRALASMIPGRERFSWNLSF